MKEYRVKWDDGSYSMWIQDKPYIEFLIAHAKEGDETISGEIEERELNHHQPKGE